MTIVKMKLRESKINWSKLFNNTKPPASLIHLEMDGTTLMHYIQYITVDF